MKPPALSLSAGAHAGASLFGALLVVWGAAIRVTFAPPWLIPLGMVASGLIHRGVCLIDKGYDERFSAWAGENALRLASPEVFVPALAMAVIPYWAMGLLARESSALAGIALIAFSLAEAIRAWWEIDR